MNCRPKFRSISFGVATSIALLVTLLPWAAAASRMDVPLVARRPPLAIGADAWKLFRATNESRERLARSKLRLNRDLSVIARRHSAAMAQSDELFHTTDVDIYLRWLSWHVWGENVGYTPGDVASVQHAFMNSAPHRENILNPAFREVAIGAVRVGGTLWVTLFFYG